MVSDGYVSLFLAHLGLFQAPAAEADRSSRNVGDLNSIAVFIWQTASEINQKIKDSIGNELNVTDTVFDAS